MLNIKTDKMKDKEKYKNLVQIIGDLLKVKGNEWLIAEVLRVVGQNHPIDKIADYPLINEIYEHCIKEVIKKQADDFYSKFPIKDKELIDKLTCAFQEMEYNRRRDRFYEFSFNLFQQIEGITNYLFDKKYKNEWKRLDDSIKKQKGYYFGRTTIKEAVNEPPVRSDGTELKWWFSSKVYLVYYIIDRDHQKKEMLKKGDVFDQYLSFDFNKMALIHMYLNIARNDEVHLGSGASDKQKEKLGQIKGNESKYYFKFYAFLEDFITKIESSYNPKGPQDLQRPQGPPTGPTDVAPEGSPPGAVMGTEEDAAQIVKDLKDNKEAQKKKEGKKYSKKKSGNLHLKKNTMFADLDLKKIVQQKSRENKENK